MSFIWMIFFLFIFMILMYGFFHIRPYTILLLLNLEGLVLFLSFMLTVMKIFQLSFGILSMIILSMAVLEAALGLCLLTLLMRFFEKEEIFFLSSLKI